MKLRYKYRIYPTSEQEQKMRSAGGAVRFLYNCFLRVNIDQYAINQKFVWFKDTCSQLTKMKSQPEYEWLTETHSQVLQQSLKDLDTALKNIKKTKAGFPNFKPKYTTPVKFRYPQGVKISVDQKTVYLPCVGWVKIKLHRSLPNFKSCTIIQTPRGWYASFVVDVQEQPLLQEVTSPVGVDVNSDFTAISCGALIANPKPLKAKSKRMKSIQRELSRKKKGSNNRRKQKEKLARIHDQIRCQRLNHTHQLSSRIAKENDLVIVETLDIDKMKKNKLVAKVVADVSWAMFLGFLEYKTQLLGHHFVKINQWLPSSRTCSACGVKKTNLTLSERTFTCHSCSHIQHRDLNAATNIRNWGHQQWLIDHARQELPQVPVDVVWDTLQNAGNESQTQSKQEATAL